MNIQVRYYTRSGNTEKLANAIADAVGVKAKSVAAPLDEKADLLFLGCSYYAFDVDDAVKKFISDNKENIKEIVCFGTSAMMKSMQKPLKKVCDSNGVVLLAEEFHIRGSFGIANKGRPNENDLKCAAEFAEGVIKNYEK